MVGLSATAALAASALVPAVTVGEPSQIRSQRAQVAQIQAQLAVIDAKVGKAAEAYNGARYRLGEIQIRIVENKRVLTTTTRRLHETRVALAQRLVQLYREPEPTLAEVMLTSGSIGQAADRLTMLDRAGRAQGKLVGDIHEFRDKLTKARVELIADRKDARVELAQRAAQRERVEALLRQRQAVLDSANRQLRRLLDQEAARQRAAALAASQRASEVVAQAQAAPQGSAPVAPATSAAPPPGGSTNASAASVALQYQGVPYVWGGASPSGFDCSGLASYAYAQVGKSVPHYTGAIWAAFPHVPSGDLQPGDLVFFNGLGHMGIYIGGGQMVHAPHTGDVVKVSSLGERSDYIGAVRP